MAADGLVMNVFVSRPTWIPPEFQNGLDGFLRLLVSMGLTPRTLGKTDYPTRTPLDEVIELLDQCAGAVILGYPQIWISTGRIRNRAIEGELLLPTEWNHIEAGLAFARGLPILVIHHTGVVRGIFDRGATSSFLYERDLSYDGWPLAEDVQGAITKWRNDCLLPKQSLENGPNEDAREPLCPNCSTAHATFRLSPIPADFQSLEGASHECTRCGYKVQRKP